MFGDTNTRGKSGILTIVELRKEECFDVFPRNLGLDDEAINPFNDSVVATGTLNQIIWPVSNRFLGSTEDGLVCAEERAEFGDVWYTFAQTRNFFEFARGLG